MPVRVYVVDDHELFRRTAAAVVEATEDFVVAGTAESFEAATFELAPPELRQADLVLMDVNLPGRSGLAGAKLLADQPGGPAVILLSTYDESTVDWRACGALDYIPKSSFSPARLLASWRAARG